MKNSANKTDAIILNLWAAVKILHIIIRLMKLLSLRHLHTWMSSDPKAVRFGEDNWFDSVGWGRDAWWTRNVSVWSEFVEEFNKLGLASIFDPPITSDGVDGCQLKLSVTRPARTPTILISILAEQHVDLHIDESNLYANHFNLDDFVTLILLT